MSRKFHVDFENLSPWVEFDQKVILSENDPSYDR